MGPWPWVHWHVFREWQCIQLIYSSIEMSERTGEMTCMYHGPDALAIVVRSIDIEQSDSLNCWEVTMILWVIDAYVGGVIDTLGGSMWAMPCIVKWTYGSGISIHLETKNPPALVSPYLTLVVVSYFPARLIPRASQYFGCTFCLLISFSLICS